MRHKRVGRLRFPAAIAYVAVAIVAVTVTVLNRSDVSTQASPLPPDVSGLGGVLSNAPASLYPETWVAKPRDVVSLSTTASAPEALAVTSSQPSLPNLPTDYPGLTLPTHVDHDGAVVAAAGERVRALGGSLTESEAISVLRAAGWPTELIPVALRVAWCESKWSEATGDGGNSVGWFQLGKSRPGWQGWFLYFGVDESLAYDFETNAKVAWLVYQYEQERGYRPFANWSCRP